MLTDDELRTIKGDVELPVQLPEDQKSDLFRRWTMAELMAEPDEFEWLVSGLLAEPTYGQLAGEMKTLKSYVLGFIEVGLAAGLPVFGQFAPRQARPVLPYVGEGGRLLWKRRRRRICAAYGVELGEIDLHPTFDVAPIQSSIFQDSLRRDLEEIEPGLVTMDPWYSYHGAATRAADLHQEGALLNQLSTPCMDAGAGLLLANHFNQTGSGTGLKRITMAGSGEWADSWLLMAHREDPDVENGLFRLSIEIGSRQWGGTSWELDLDIGRFDVVTGTHDGEISWDLHRASAGGAKSTKTDVKAIRVRQEILDILTDCPWELTRSKVKTMVGGGRETFDETFNQMVEDGEIAHNRLGRTEAGTTKQRLLWGLTPTRADQSRPGWQGAAD